MNNLYKRFMRNTTDLEKRRSEEEMRMIMDTAAEDPDLGPDLEIEIVRSTDPPVHHPAEAAALTLTVHHTRRRRSIRKRRSTRRRRRVQRRRKRRKVLTPTVGVMMRMRWGTGEKSC